MYLLPILVCCISYALAAPSDFHSRNNDSGNLRLWVPILVVGLMLFLGTWVACNRGCWLTNWGSGAALASGSVTNDPSLASASASRELTAEELTRGTRGTTSANSNRTGTTGRRARRARRTPSQVSTKSLPAYNKDPGEHELVIYSGPPEEDENEVDETMNSSTTAVMSTIEEQPGSGLSHDVTSTVSLLPQAEIQDTPPQGLGTTGPGSAPVRPRSEITMASDESSSALLEAGNDPRGDAPPYEIINLDEEQHQDSRFLPNDIVFPRQPQHTQMPSERNRLSGFLSFFTPRGSNHVNSGSAADPRRNAAGHSRDTSGPSFPILTSVESHGSQRSGQPRRGHRPNNSSGSGLSLSAFRTITRTRSNPGDDFNNPLTSPSLISLHSISAPLTHTAVRTEFTYPRSGPTPEQVKFISSRETFGRFGLPYGPDAVAFAASVSRHDLVPPPDFASLNGHGGIAANDSSQTSAAEEVNVASNSTGFDQVQISPPSTSSSSSSDSDVPEPIPASDEPSPPPQNEPPTNLAAPPPSSFRFDPSQPLAPARSVSMASSYATFETAPDSIPTIGAPHIHALSPPNNHPLVSLDAVQPGTGDNECDNGESIRSGIVRTDNTEGQQIKDFGGLGEDESEEDEQLNNENITNIARHAHEGIDSTLRLPATPQMEEATSSSPLSSPSGYTSQTSVHHLIADAIEAR